MALPMVHLSVAHQLVCAYGYRPAPAFYLGSIAPDAIHMRPGTDREDKWAVHLSLDGAIDVARVQQLMAECWRASADTAFAEGYCVHLLTDRYWRDEVVWPLLARLGNMSRQEQRILYYAECDKIDLELYDRQPWREDVWALLQRAEAGDFVGLLAQQEIEMWRDRVLGWFEENRNKGDYSSHHLTREMALGFIRDASSRASEQMASWRRSVDHRHPPRGPSIS
jgi:hypothetical protein